MEQATGVLCGEATELIKGHSQKAGHLVCGVEEMARLIALAPNRLGWQVGTVGLQDEAIQPRFARDLSE